MGGCMSSPPSGSQSLHETSYAEQSNERARRRLSQLAEGLAVPPAQATARLVLSGELDMEVQSGETALKIPWCTASAAGTDPIMLTTKRNQDSFCVQDCLGNNQQIAFFGVFDGHGSAGAEVSRTVAATLPRHIASQESFPSDIHHAVSQAYIDTDIELEEQDFDVALSGTTVVSVVLDGRRRILSANAGDSRAVLGTRRADGTFAAIDLTIDHKPDLPEERRRILAANGRVDRIVNEDGEFTGPYRVWLAEERLPGLAMSRSLGDTIAGSVGVCAEPMLYERECRPNDEFLIIASDGVWEFLSSQQVVDMVASSPGLREAAVDIVRESNSLWVNMEEVVDDITVVVVQLAEWWKQPPTSVSSAPSRSA